MHRCPHCQARLSLSALSKANPNATHSCEACGGEIGWDVSGVRISAVIVIAALSVAGLSWFGADLPSGAIVLGLLACIGVAGAVGLSAFRAVAR